MMRQKSVALAGAFLAAAFLTAALPAWGAAVDFDLRLDIPPIVSDSKAPVGCTVAYIVADIANNDLFAVRMRIANAETDSPTNNRLPCPANPSSRVALRAMDACLNRAGDAKSCVFGDMARGFESEPAARNTSEIGSRCSSDKFSDIGVACLKAGKLSVCSVGCGNSPEAAQAAAKARCEDKQQRACPVSASIPVSGP